MNQDQLSELIKRPEIQHRIVGSYTGAYAIGLTLNPADRREVAIRVRIEGGRADAIPAQVFLEGEAIPVVVNTGFQSPEPLAQRKAGG